MTSSSEYIDHIEHWGVVESVDVRAQKVRVKLATEAGCDGCAAAKLCGSSGKKVQTIDVETKIAGAFRPGDKVVVSGTELMHRRAILLATVIPCVVLVAVMVGVYLLSGSQSLAAICGLASTVLFFAILYLCRNKIAHEFRFTIKAIHNSPNV